MGLIKWSGKVGLQSAPDDVFLGFDPNDWKDGHDALREIEERVDESLVVIIEEAGSSAEEQQYVVKTLASEAGMTGFYNPNRPALEALSGLLESGERVLELVRPPAGDMQASSASPTGGSCSWVGTSSCSRSRGARSSGSSARESRGVPFSSSTRAAGRRMCSAK